MEQINEQRKIIIEDNGNKKERLPVVSDSLSQKAINHFENLSNEIIYEIFEFLDMSVTYEAFSNLNIRFEQLLIYYPCPINVNFSSKSSRSLEWSFNNVLLPYQHRIKSMRLSNPILINRVFSFDRNPIVFNQLEKLRLDDFNPDSSKKIFTQLLSFPCLTSLIIKPIDWSEIKNTFYQAIFRLPKLKYCRLLNEISYRRELLPIAENEYSSIEHLIINYMICPKQFIALLSYLPQLRRLSIDQVYQESSQLIEIYPMALNHLTHVSLKVHLNFDVLRTIVQKLFHQIQVFVLSVSDIETYFDARKWEELISLHMKNLRIFNIDIFCDCTNYYNFDYYINLTDQFNSSFWRERQWFFERYVYKDEQAVSLYLRTLHRQKCSYNIGSDANNGKRIIDVAHDVKLGEKSFVICRKYFPNAINLSFTNTHRLNNAIDLRTEFNRIIPLKQLTTLRFWMISGSFSQLVELLSDMPNLHTIDVFYITVSENFMLIQQTEIFLSVSRSNHIKTMTFHGLDTLETIAFLLALCPRLQHLNIDLCTISVQSILHFLFSEDNQNTACLTSLYLSNDKEKTGIVKDFIESEKLLDDYLIHEEERPTHSVYLLWSKQ